MNIKYFVVFLFIPTIIFTAEKFNIQEKNESIESLKKKHFQEIYLLEKKHAEALASLQSQISCLQMLLEQNKTRDQNSEERHPLAAMHGYK